MMKGHIKDDAKKVEEGIKDNLSEAAQSTKDTLEQDKEEVEELIRDGEWAVKEAAHDITHPKDLGSDISKAAHEAVEHERDRREGRQRHPQHSGGADRDSAQD